MRFAALALLAPTVLLAACSSKEKAAPSGAASAASATASPAEAKSAPSPSAAVPVGLQADASGVLTLAWKVTQGAKPNVGASITVGAETITLPPLDATSDDPDEDGTVKACTMRGSTATSSELWCGGTPALNYYTAKLAGGALVVTRTEGVDGEPSADKVTEVARRPTAATSLKMTGPASPLLYGNCRPGYVQKTPDSPCMKQCLKGTGCKANEKCQLTSVTGGDGPHKVSACVPAAK